EGWARRILACVTHFSNSRSLNAFLDLAQSPRLRRSPMPTPDRREGADLIVVGASVGGLVAAIVAADRARQVAVVEGGKEHRGGASLTPGAVPAARSH